MKKKSINVIIPFIESFVNHNLDHDRLKKMLTTESGLGSGDKDKLLPEAEIFLSVWIDAMVQGLSSNKDKLKSDFIVDYVLELMNYFKGLETDLDITDFDQSFSDLISNPILIKAMKDTSLIESLMKIKDEHTKKIVETLKSENNVELFKKNIRKIMPGFKFVDKDMFGI
jgi:poly-beta-hydroxyalkanoate depolymerase